MTVLAHVLKLWPDRTFVEIREKEPVPDVSLTEGGPGEQPSDRNVAFPAPAYTAVEPLEEERHIPVEPEEALVGIDTLVDWGKAMIPDIALVEADAMMWLQEHPEVWTEYADQWVALTADGICTASHDINIVFQQAEQRGVRDPIVFKISGREEPKFYANH